MSECNSYCQSLRIEMRTDSMPLIYATFGYAVDVSAPAQKSQSGAQVKSWFHFSDLYHNFAFLPVGFHVPVGFNNTF